VARPKPASLRRSRKRPKPRRSHPRAAELFDLSDDDLGRWLAELHRGPLESAACDAYGIEELYKGQNLLIEPLESRLAKDLIKRLIDMRFDLVLSFDRDAPELLAAWLALTGQYERAGQAFRKAPGLRRVQTERAQKMASVKGRKAIAQRKILREAAWQRIGRGIREGERESRQTNRELASAIWKRCPKENRAAVSTIIQAVPRLGLDKRKWDREQPLRPARAGIKSRTIKTFATRNRSSFGHLQFGKNKSVSR
jgi:hypothetical protein